jgi:hypothetical protein
VDAGLRKLWLWLAAAACLLALAAVAFYVLLWRVTVRDEAALAAIRRDTEQRIALREQLPADQNGFTELAPLLQKTAPPAELAALRVLDAYDKGSRAATEAALNRDPRRTRRDVQIAERLLPRVRRVLARQRLVIPSHYRQGINASPGIDFLALRGLAQNLVRQGLWQELGGNRRAALDNYLMVIELANKAAESGHLLQQMIVGAVHRIGIEPLLRLLGDPRLDEASLLEAQRRLGRLRANEQYFAHSMDEEYLTGLVSFEDTMRGGPAAFPLPQPWTMARGLVNTWLAREMRVLQNVHLQFRPYYVSLDDAGLDAAVQRPMSRLESLRMRLSPLVVMLQPNSARAMQWFKMALANERAALVLAAIRVHHARHGAWPATLAELGKLPMDPWSGRPFAYKRVGNSFELASNAPANPALGRLKGPLYYP